MEEWDVLQASEGVNCREPEWLFWVVTERGWEPKSLRIHAGGGRRAVGTGLCLLQDFLSHLCDFRCSGFPKVQGLTREPCSASVFIPPELLTLLCLL